MLPSTLRRYDTWLCSVFTAAAGAASPQTTSTRWPVLTISPPCSARVASTALRRKAAHRPRPAGRHDINRPEKPHLHESPVLPRKIDPELKHEPRPSAVRWHSNRLQNVAVGEHGFRGAWPVTVRDQPQARPRTIWTLPATQMSSFGRLWS